MHPTDTKLALAIFAICAVLYYITTTFDEVSPLLAQNIPPEWFPRLLIWTIVVLTLLIPIEHRLTERGTKSVDADRSERIPPMAFYTSLFLIAVVATVVLFGIFIAMFVVCGGLPLLWGERRWKLLVPFAVLFPLAVTLLFTFVLKVFFDPGLYGPAL